MKETAFAEQLRTKHGLTLGTFGDTAYAPDGKPYLVLQGTGGEDEATEAFTRYCAGRTGWLHWRVMPEIKYLPKGGRYFLHAACAAMSNVVNLKGETELQKPDMVADVIAFLRKHADELEKGGERPAHKAVLILYEDLGDKTRLASTFCNTTVTERVGMMFMALQDTAG